MLQCSQLLLLLLLTSAYTHIPPGPTFTRHPATIKARSRAILASSSHGTVHILLMCPIA